MKVKIAVQELAKPLRKIRSFLPSKPSFRESDFVQFSVSKGVASLTGLNPSIWRLEVKVRAEAEHDCAFLLPPQRLAAILANLLSEDLTMEPLESGAVSLEAGTYRATLTTLSHENFPPAVELPETTCALLNLSALQDLIDKTQFAVPEDEKSTCLAVARLESTGEQIRLIGTEGARLVIASFDGSAEKFHLHIPEPSLALLRGLTGAVIRISEIENAIFFQTELETLVAAKLSGEFPPYEKILPLLDTYGTQVKISTEVLKGAIDRVFPVVDDTEHSIILFSVAGDGGQLVLSAKSEAGEASDRLNVATNGPTVQAGINAKKLTPFLKHATGDLEINFKHSRTGVNFQNGPNYRMVVMPIVMPESKQSPQRAEEEYKEAVLDA